MNVKLRVTISGTRNGQDWPPAGTVVELPDDEAVALLNAGIAEAVTVDAAPVETAAAPADGVQTAAPAPAAKSTRVDTTAKS